MLTRLKTSTVAIAIVTKNLTGSPPEMRNQWAERLASSPHAPPTITSRMAWSEPCGLRRPCGYAEYSLRRIAGNLEPPGVNPTDLQHRAVRRLLQQLAAQSHGGRATSDDPRC